MTIDISIVQSPYVFRIDPGDACRIQWRRNEHRARWLDYCSYETAQMAREKLFGLARAGMTVEQEVER